MAAAACEAEVWSHVILAKDARGQRRAAAARCEALVLELRRRDGAARDVR